MRVDTSLVITQHGNKRFTTISWRDGELGIKIYDLDTEKEIDILLSAQETQHLVSFILTHQANTASATGGDATEE